MNLNDPKRASDELKRAVDTADHETIARAAMFHIWPLLTSHTVLLISAVSILDTSVLDRYPVLRLVHPVTAVLARTTRPFRPLIYSDDARSMRPEEVDFLILAQIIGFRTSGDVSAALLYAKRLSDRIQQIRIESRDRLDGPLWYFHYQIGSTYLAAGDSAQALLEFATARQFGRLSAQQDAERVVLGRIALAHAVRGALIDAERVLDEARQLPAPGPAHAGSSTTTEATTAALIAADRMAEGVDDLCASLCSYDSTDLTWPFALLVRTRVSLAREQPEDAIEAIRLARDSHPEQTGSFATDVIGGSYIRALLQTGELIAARRVAHEYAGSGMLTQLATVRLSLRDGNRDAAATDLQLLLRDQGVGPAQRAECVLLAGWLELARTDDLGRETAMQIFRVVRRPESRRLAAIMPRQVMERVRARLPEESARELDALACAIAHFDLDERPDLTAGEMRVLNALLHHNSTAAMASSFHVSPNTIKSQLRSVYRKLGCSTRGEALRIATRLHLLVQDVGA